jgi:hypothetical protein
MPARVRLRAASLGWWIQHRVPEVRRGFRLERDGGPRFPGWVQPQFACSRQAQVSRGPKTSRSRETAVGASQPAVHVTTAPTLRSPNAAPPIPLMEHKSTLAALVVCAVASGCVSTPPVTVRNQLPMNSEVAVVMFRDCAIPGQEEDCTGSVNRRLNLCACVLRKT